MPSNSRAPWSKFLSIQAQDFIEDARSDHKTADALAFLSIQAQDFIEESKVPYLTNMR